MILPIYLTERLVSILPYRLFITGWRMPKNCIRFLFE